MKILSKDAKKREALRQLKKELKGDILNVLTRKLESAISSGSIPEYFYEEGNWLLSKSVIDSFCRDRPYSMLDTGYRKDCENIHLFI